jgi:hypothetical protein
MPRFPLPLTMALVLCAAACGKSNTAATVKIPFLNASQNPAFAPVVPLIEGGVFSAMHAANATGKFYEGWTVQALEAYGTNNAIGGDPNDTLAEQATVDGLVAQSQAKILLGPATWTSYQDFCTQRQYLCISHSAAAVRNDPNYNFSFTTAGYYPGWALGTAYDISAQGYTNVLFLANYDTTFDAQQMERFGINVTEVSLPADDPANWASEPNGLSPDGYAQQILASTFDAIILQSSAQGVAAIYQALQARNFTETERIWIGGETNFTDFVGIVGNVAAAKVNKVYEQFKDSSSSSFQAYEAQFQAWGNNPPTGDWELSAYWAAMLSVYTVHAQLVAQQATASTVLNGQDLRQTMLKLTNSEPGATPYWISDTAAILSAISAGQSVHIQGFGLPFAFSDDGRAAAPCQKQKCCQLDSSNASTGQPITTFIATDTILNAMQ